MRRREFITLLGGAAAAWPLAAPAQQGERVRRIGVLMTLAADDPEGQTRLVAFVQGLQQLGWTVCRNMRIDTRWAAGDAERIRKYAAELVALSPDVILAAGGPTVGPMQQATHAVPIVFAIVTDPVGAGKQIAPRVTRVAVLRDSALASGIGQLGALQSAAPSVGVEVTPVGVRGAGEIERGITAFARGSNDGLIVTGSALAFVNRDLPVINYPRSIGTARPSPAAA
jgi:putative tryptophan/tyrosine transport system substrate-binding protein